ncbi:MAG: hypothetical protein ACYDIC_13565 [Desulfobaccales bacterium]
MSGRLIVIMAALAAVLILPGMAVAQAQSPTPQQAPAATPAAPPAPQAAPAPEHPQAGPGPACPMMSPEQMQQMQGKMGQKCCMMQPGQANPKCEQMQKQIDELQQRVEALEGQKKGKKK